MGQDVGNHTSIWFIFGVASTSWQGQSAHE